MLKEVKELAQDEDIEQLSRTFDDYTLTTPSICFISNLKAGPVRNKFG